MKSLDLRIENLENPQLRPILDRAEERIEEALQSNPPEVSYHPRDEEIEIPSFPVAVMLAAASASDYVRRRYALAEARRAYRLLQEGDARTVMEVAQLFAWRIEMLRRMRGGGRYYDFALDFADFLRNTRSLREKEWKLVNRFVLNGQVYLTRREGARLLQEEIRRHIEEKLDVDIRSKLPDSLVERVKNLKRRHAGQIGKARFERYVGEVVEEAFPPCIRLLYEAAKTGRHLSHVGRFTLTSFLISIGMKPAEVVDIFRASSDFNERMTKYQVEHISGDRGSRTRYIPPTCETLRTHGLCPGEEDLCKGVRHPLTCYRRKTRMVKKEAPVSQV